MSDKEKVIACTVVRPGYYMKGVEVEVGEEVKLTPRQIKAFAGKVVPSDSLLNPRGGEASAKIQEELDELRAENSELEAKVQELTENGDEGLQKQIEELEAKVETLETANQELQEQVDELTEANEGFAQANEDLEKALAKSKKKK